MRAGWAGLGLALGLLFAQTAQAQEGTAAVEIEADAGIEWLTESRTVEARGNVVASRGTTRLSADRVTAHYRDGDTDRIEIHRMIARGNVVTREPDRVASGDQAVLDLDREIIVLSGRTPRFETQDATLTARDELEYRIGDRTAIARGEATALAPNGTMKADVLLARFEQSEDGSLEVVHLDARGNITIVTAQEIVRADKGVYNPRKGTATLTGNVRISRGGSQLNGDTAELDLESGTARLLAGQGEQVRGLIMPTPDEEE